MFSNNSALTQVQSPEHFRCHPSAPHSLGSQLLNSLLELIAPCVAEVAETAPPPCHGVAAFFPFEVFCNEVATPQTTRLGAHAGGARTGHHGKAAHHHIIKAGALTCGTVPGNLQLTMDHLQKASGRKLLRFTVPVTNSTHCLASPANSVASAQSRARLTPPEAMVAEVADLEAFAILHPARAFLNIKVRTGQGEDTTAGPSPSVG